MSHRARRSRAEAPDAAVDLAAGEVRRAFEAWAERLVKLLVADYVPSVARHSADSAHYDLDLVAIRIGNSRQGEFAGLELRDRDVGDAGRTVADQAPFAHCEFPGGFAGGGFFLGHAQMNGGALADLRAFRADATIEGLFREAGRARPRAEVLERAFTMLDKQSADELRVTGVRTADVIPKAQTRKQEWLRQNTDLIKGEADLRRRVERVLEDPLNQGRSVADIAKLLEEQAGYSTSRAVLTARDQTLKLYGQIQQERQQNAGIERYVWTTSLDERVRPDHADLDGTIQRWDDPPIVDQRTGRRGHPGLDFQCLPGDSKIGFTSRINRAFRRWYSGQLTTLVTESGVTLQATPNHPVLTLSGWKAAHAVQVGDCVVQAREQCSGFAEAEVEHRETPVSYLFQALALAFGARRPLAIAPQFHDDALVDQHVDVVDVDRMLRPDIEAALTQRLCEFDLAVSDETAAGLRDADQVLVRLGLAAYGSIGGLRECLATFLGRAREACDIGGASIAGLHALTDEEGADGLARHPVALGEAFYRGAIPLQLQAFIVREWLRVGCRQVDAAPSVEHADSFADRFAVEAQRSANSGPGLPLGAEFARVVGVSLRDFSGHVFNLSTDSNWYVAQRVFMHNCRCTAVAVLDEPAEGEAPAEQQRQVELRERAVAEGRAQAPRPPPQAPPPRERVMTPTQAELDAERARHAAEAEQLRLEREADARIASARAEAQRLEAERQAAQQREIERQEAEARALEAAREAERKRLAAEAAAAEARARAEAAAARTREAERLAELERQAEATRQAEEARAREVERAAEARRLAEAERRVAAAEAERKRLEQLAEAKRKAVEARQSRETARAAKAQSSGQAKAGARLQGMAARVEFDAPPEWRDQIADALEQAGASRLEGLGFAKLKQLTIKERASSLSTKGANGFYVNGALEAAAPDAEDFAKNYTSMADAASQRGAWATAYITQDPIESAINSLVHEFGHHVDNEARSHSAAQRIIREAYADIVLADRPAGAKGHPSADGFRGQAPTRYARHDQGELWAESFSLYHRHPEWLKTNSPKAFQMVESVLREIKL